MNFVKAYLEHTKDYESPTSFWKWSAFTAIAAVLRDNCYRRQLDIRTYPNVYTLLLADSAVHRKGNPVKLCESLVSRVQNTKVISGRSSIQAILDELSRGETNKLTGQLISGGSALFSASELSAGIVNDPEAVKILTDIYDFKDEYTSRLRGAGIFRIKNICFSMIAASNEDLLRDVYDSKAVFGGLLGRTFLIKPNEFRRGNSLLNETDSSANMDRLYKMLKEISYLKGEFQLTEEARTEYDKWYLPFRESYSKIPDKSGVSGRIHTGVFKIAMILCANYTLNLTIEKVHIEEAIEECLALLQNYNQFLMSQGKSSISEVGAIVLQDLWEDKDHFMSRKEILSRHWSKFSHEDLDKLALTMIQAGMLKDCMLDGGIGYMLTDKCKTMLSKGSKRETIQ